MKYRYINFIHLRKYRNNHLDMSPPKQAMNAVWITKSHFYTNFFNRLSLVLRLEKAYRINLCEFPHGFFSVKLVRQKKLSILKLRFET